MLCSTYSTRLELLCVTYTRDAPLDRMKRLLELLSDGVLREVSMKFGSTCWESAHAHAHVLSGAVRA